MKNRLTEEKFRAMALEIRADEWGLPLGCQVLLDEAERARVAEKELSEKFVESGGWYDANGRPVARYDKVCMLIQPDFILFADEITPRERKHYILLDAAAG